MVAKRTGVQLIPFQELNPPAAGAGVGVGVGVHPRPGSTSNKKNGPEFGKPAAAVAALAELAMAELLALAQLGEPMWVRGPDGLTEELNQVEYARAFANGLGPKNVNLATEATRATAIVAMPAEALVDMLMDVVSKKLTAECINALPQGLIFEGFDGVQEKWIAFFSGIVTGAATVEVYATGAAAGSHDGALQLVKLCPLVFTFASRH